MQNVCQEKNWTAGKIENTGPVLQGMQMMATGRLDPKEGQIISLFLDNDYEQKYYFTCFDIDIQPKINFTFSDTDIQPHALIFG